MDSVGRFSSRVENYVKYRPSYPEEVLDLLTEECGLRPGSVVADVGSGTGIFSRLLLERGYRVFGVEPGDEMRAVSERDFMGVENFTSVPRKAEDTGLGAHSVDLVTVAQAFHWLDISGFRAECLRILHPGGWVAIVWNSRKSAGNAFLKEYEALLKSLESDYTQINHREVTREAISSFYGSDHYRYLTFPNEQILDWDGLLGRALSSSYVPLPEDPGYGRLMSELERIFQVHSEGGK
ncbi:MAG: class I SAM-dependent methyltransferase, partial [Chlorobia bacterium]|nr:class I SAM-dependent methyltransferase [Fimbriimonadaceae bacterium]